MELNFDAKTFIDMMLNQSLMEEKELAPVVKVCNKYGIQGMKVIEFLMELSVAVQQTQGDNNNG